MQDEHITAYPLCWPPGKPRTSSGKRISGQFGYRASTGYMKSITLDKATARVLGEINKFTKPGRLYRTSNLIISTNVELRKSDGLPKSGRLPPTDAGVAVYFTLDDKQRCIPCDHYLRVADNMAAIAATIEALRTIERHGSEMFEAAFTGFTALPSPDSVGDPHWRTILEYQGSDLDEARRQYKRKCSQHHPDNGGDKDLFHTINKSWEHAKLELSE